MLSQQARELIQEAIGLLSITSISQSAIDNATNLIKRACESIKNENEENKEMVLNERYVTVYEKTSYGLVQKFENKEITNKEVVYTSTNPEVAVVNDYGYVEVLTAGKAEIICEHKESGLTAKCEINAIALPEEVVKLNTVADLKSADLSEGTLVETVGYYNEGDGGSAKYLIMTYDNWFNTLHPQNKMVQYHVDRIGANPVFYPNPVDNRGNHLLNNGLVAKIINDDVIKVEQWGIFEDRNDVVDCLRHLFANIKSGEILFGKDKVYNYYYNKYNQGQERKDEIITDDLWWLNKDSIGKGNEYALLNGCRGTSKPILGFIHGLKINGNNCTIYLPDNEFSKETGNNFATFECGGIIDGLEITGFNFNNNGLNQNGYYDDSNVFNTMRTCNHTISYFSSTPTYAYLEESYREKALNKYNLDIDSCYMPYEKTRFNNVNIHHNNFYCNGTNVDTNDSGGDFVLIINPRMSKNVRFEDNYCENWGRWVFSVDLGGEGECFEDYKINRNTCIQNINNCHIIDGVPDLSKFRGLGWIDFEARKCWKNLEVCDNKVVGANGFAINGNGKISENILIKGNNIIRNIEGASGWRSIYPYSFEWYSVKTKNLIFENNYIGGGTTRFGYMCDTFTFRGNDIKVPVRIDSLQGDMIFENNEEIQIQVVNKNTPDYIKEEDKYCNLIIRNNKKVKLEGGPGQEVTLVNGLDVNKYSHISLDISGNEEITLLHLNAMGVKEGFYFDPTQMQPGTIYSVKGAKLAQPAYTVQTNGVVVGGFMAKVGDILTTNLKDLRRLDLPSYYDEQRKLRPWGNEGNTTTKSSLICIKDGYLPTVGGFLKSENDTLLVEGKSSTVTKNTVVCTYTDVYITCNDGTITEIPTHKEGIALCGDVELRHYSELADIEAID